MDKPRYFGNRVKGTQLAVAAFVISLALFLAVLGGTAYLLTHKTQTTAQIAEELRAGLVENCEVNGNPLREVVQKLLQEQINSAEKLIPTIFPQIPPSILEEHIAEDRELMTEIEVVDCQAQYPRP